MGKDLTDFANRHKIKVFRNLNGEKNIEILDLTSTELLKSEYYYILPNDIVYAEPISRVFGANTLSVATILSTINASFSIYYFFNNILKPNN
jgi:polysaccharide biosynthesis/export protein